MTTYDPLLHMQHIKDAAAPSAQKTTIFLYREYAANKVILTIAQGGNPGKNDSEEVSLFASKDTMLLTALSKKIAKSTSATNPTIQARKHLAGCSLYKMRGARSMQARRRVG